MSRAALGDPSGEGGVGERADDRQEINAGEDLNEIHGPVHDIDTMRLSRETGAGAAVCGVRGVCAKDLALGRLGFG